MKILCIHASAGAGHLKAAEAVYLGLKDSSEHDVVFVDALDHTSDAFKNLYRGTYTFLITHVPWLWGFVFALLDWPILQSAIRGFRRIYNTINTKGLHEYLVKEQFDYIVSCHFMPNEVSCALKRAGKIKSKVISVVTDYDVHRIWLADGIDYYAVATDWTRGKMGRLNVPLEQVFVTGIPTNEKFSERQDISELKDKLGVKRDVFTVLIATGSFGIGPIEEIIEACDDFQVIVICGHNKSLYERMSKINKPLVKVFGLVDNMHEMMAVADTMVTKPGGLSISEALVSQLPLIFFNPIPGQETNNIMVLRKYGVGISDCSISEIVEELKKLRSSRDLYLTTLKKTTELARPSAVKDIISLIK